MPSGFLIGQKAILILSQSYVSGFSALPVIGEVGKKSSFDRKLDGDYRRAPVKKKLVHVSNNKGKWYWKTLNF